MTTITVTRYPDPTWHSRKAIVRLELDQNRRNEPEHLRELGRQMLEKIIKYYARDEYADDRTAYAINLLNASLMYANLGGDPFRGIHAYFQMQPERLKNQLLEICREASART